MRQTILDVGAAWPNRTKRLRSAAVEVLSDRQLNRATLARQLLLEPSSLDPLAAVTHLVGLQAQVPNNPHVALWARLASFEPSQLDSLLEARAVVRSAAIRGTIHLLTADDCLDLWPLSQPVLQRELGTHRDLGTVAARRRSHAADGMGTGVSWRRRAHSPRSRRH